MAHVLTAIRKGGKNRFGDAYLTLWRFNTANFGFILKLVRELGHDIKYLPNRGFPPAAMLARLEAFKAKLAAGATRKLTERATELQAQANAQHEAEQAARAMH